MTVHYVGVGEIAVGAKPDDVIRTLALGSCVAIVILDPVHRVVGMDHVALPDSSIDPNQAKGRPGYFADTGLPALLEAMVRCGASRDPRSLCVKLVGGALTLPAGTRFDIGKRNILAIKKLLWARGMGPLSEDVGGAISRTVDVDVEAGRVRISSPGRGAWEI
jgi:chemotaxis protein CheD